MRVSVSYVKNVCVSRTMRESRALDITRVEPSSSEEPCQCCWHYCLYSEDVKGLQMLSHYYCFSNWLGWQNSLYFSTNAWTYFWAEETKIEGGPIILLLCLYTMPGSLSPFLYISNVFLSLPHPFFLLSLSLLFFLHSPCTTTLHLEGLFEFRGYCVRRCPPNYFSREGQCIPCDEPCPTGRRVLCSHGNQTSFMLP